MNVVVRFKKEKPGLAAPAGRVQQTIFYRVRWTVGPGVSVYELRTFM
jgi:hypothetical protein